MEEKDWDEFYQNAPRFTGKEPIEEVMAIMEDYSIRFALSRMDAKDAQDILNSPLISLGIQCEDCRRKDTETFIAKSITFDKTLCIDCLEKEAQQLEKEMRKDI